MTTLTAPPTAEDSGYGLGYDDDQAADPAADVLPPVVVTPADAAPYGYQADGVTPKKRPGRRPGQRNGTGQAAQKGTTASKTPGPPVAKKAASKPPQRTTQVDYRPGILGLFGQGTMAALTLGVLRQDPALIADAATVDNAAPAIADAINTAADQWPIVAAVCDKVLTIGPHASGLVALVGMVAQIGVNHGLLPPGLVPGTMSRDQLAAAYVKRQAEASEEFRLVLAFAQQHQAAATPADQPAAAS